MKRILKIETTSLCNQKCQFCPQTEYKLKNQVMPISLFSKIMDSIKALNIEISCIHFGGMGEPLLDPSLFGRIHYAKTLTNEFTLTTNGYYLTNTNLTQVNKYFSKVFFSFHGNTPEEYEKLSLIHI